MAPEDQIMRSDLEQDVLTGVYGVLTVYDAECDILKAGIRINGHTANPGRVIAEGKAELIDNLCQEKGYNPVKVREAVDECFLRVFSR